jgi:hypothetical protein
MRLVFSPQLSRPPARPGPQSLFSRAH